MSEPLNPPDRYGRPLRDLRLSVTDRCNFRCTYCMPAELFDANARFLPRDKLLSFDEMARLAGIFAGLGIRKIRITGGEPLLRPHLPDLVRRLRRIAGIADIALTTNGVLLPRFAASLREAGLQRVTVSLDALDDDVFMKLNGVGCKVRPILDGIDAAQAAGLTVKINMLVKRGCNEHQIMPMARYFKARRIPLRFIEYMDVGNSNGWRLEHVVPSREVLKLIQAELPVEPVDAAYGDVARRYRYADDTSEIGFISSVTEAFCSTCTRARISAEGYLYTCLFAAQGYDLRSWLRSGAPDEDVSAEIVKLWNERHDRYSQERSVHYPARERRAKVEMSHIGG